VIRAVFLDLDGTLVGSEGRVSPRVRRAVTRAREAGCHVVLCTGRSRYATVPVADRDLGFRGYAIVSNGAVVMHLGSGELLCCNRIPSPVACRVIRTFLDAGVSAHAYEDSIESARILYHPDYGPESFNPERHRPWPAMRDSLPYDPICISGYGPEEQLRPLAERLTLEAPPGTYVEEAGTHRSWCVEVHHEQSGKCNGLQRVAERLGVAREEILAIGDHLNDLRMLRFAGTGVAMGNALPEVRADADYVTGTVEQDGVAEAIERFVLGGTGRGGSHP
jgi:Cof subfamily protein (haloacid dehalogenase superfamily)